MGVEVHLIPTNGGFQKEAFYLDMVKRGVHIHAPDDWSMLTAEDVVVGFWNEEFFRICSYPLAYKENRFCSIHDVRADEKGSSLLDSSPCYCLG